MNPIHEQFDWQCLTPEPGHYFFGYYDRCAWNADNTKHLALKVGQCERLPERGETADDMALLARREMYTATVPAQVLVLTCGIDVQDDRFELELVGGASERKAGASGIKRYTATR
jgi:hypothetical protein